MSYTLNLTSIEFPINVNHPELAEYIRQSASELKKKNWIVTIIDIPSHASEHGGTYNPYQRIEAKRQMPFIDHFNLSKCWETKLIGYAPAQIGVTFPEANIYRNGNRQVGPCFVHGDHDGLVWSYHCTVQDQVEIRVDGGNQWGEDNMNKFCAVLDSWDQKFKIARKLKQLIGVAVSQNQGAIDRLRGEILEQVMAL
jgi:hypothetical protein